MGLNKCVWVCLSGHHFSVRKNVLDFIAWKLHKLKCGNLRGSFYMICLTRSTCILSYDNAWACMVENKWSEIIFFIHVYVVIIVNVLKYMYLIIETPLWALFDSTLHSEYSLGPGVSFLVLAAGTDHFLNVIRPALRLCCHEALLLHIYLNLFSKPKRLSNNFVIHCAVFSLW